MPLLVKRTRNNSFNAHVLFSGRGTNNKTQVSLFWLKGKIHLYKVPIVKCVMTWQIKLINECDECILNVARDFVYVTIAIPANHKVFRNENPGVDVLCYWQI